MNVKSLIASLLVVALLLPFVGCDKDSGTVSLADLVGFYLLRTLTDKGTNTTYTAGQPHTEDGVTITVTGTLELTQNTYESIFQYHYEAPLLGLEDTETEEDTGTYTINGNKVTLVSDEDNETTELTFDLDGDVLTLEDDEMASIWDRQ